MYKKFLFGAILSAAVCLSACKKETELIDDFTATTTAVSKTVQSDVTGNAENVPEKSEGLPDIVLNADGEDAELAARRKKNLETADYFAERGFEFSVNNDLTIDMAAFPDNADPFSDVEKKYLDRVLGVRLKNCAERNFDFLKGVKNLEDIVFEDDPGEADMSFLADCEKLYSLWFSDKGGNMEKLAEAVKSSCLKRLYIDASEYAPGSADAVMRAAPSCEVQYNMKDHAYSVEREGLMLYTNMLVSTSAERKSLACTFMNFTDEDKTVTSLRILNWHGEELAFADGGTVHNIELAVKAGARADFEISEETFPFADCDTGVYKIEFDCGGEKLTQNFAIDNGSVIIEQFSTDSGEYKEYQPIEGPVWHEGNYFDFEVPAFLNEEQQAAYRLAFYITHTCFGSSGYLSEEYFDEHTEEEFYDVYCKGYTRDYARSKLEHYGFLGEDGKLRAGAWDGGSDLSYFGSTFIPLYSDENEVFFKCVSVHCYDYEAPYSVWFEEESFHMLNTDGGWKFDSFSYLG